MARKVLAMPPKWSKQFFSWDEVPVLFYIDTASILLQKTEDTVRRMCEDRRIPATQMGKQWVFEKNTFQKHFQKSEENNENLHQCTV